MTPRTSALTCECSQWPCPNSLGSVPPDVHNAEFVLTGVLTQTLDYESYPFRGHMVGAGEAEGAFASWKQTPWSGLHTFSLLLQVTKQGPVWLT